MNHKYRIGEKVKILWHRTNYTRTRNYMDTGEVRSHLTSSDGTPYVELYNFHKNEKYHSLYFPLFAVRPLGEVVKDGDSL